MKITQRAIISLLSDKNNADSEKMETLLSYLNGLTTPLEQPLEEYVRSYFNE